MTQPNASRRQLSLVQQVASGNLSLPRSHRQQRKFFKLLKRLGTHREFLKAIANMRDSVLRSAILAEEQQGGVIALCGAHSGGGTSLLSLLLTLSLGASRHYRVAYIDGRFSPERFEALTRVLLLSRNDQTIHKGVSSLEGHHSERHPNIYFFNNAGGEQGLDFFSDRGLKSCIAELKAHFDFTVIDMPPLLEDPSNNFLVPLVDRIYLVASPGKTRRAEIQSCVDHLAELGTKVSGVILNRQRMPFWTRWFWRDYFA